MSATMLKMELAVGIIGCVVSFVMFLHPWPTMVAIHKERSTKQRSYYRYIISLSNSLYWFLYGLPFVHRGRYMIIIINGLGITVSVGYISFFLWKCNHQRTRRGLLLWLVVITLVYLAIAMITYCVFQKINARSHFAGIFGMLFGILMYGFPLYTLKEAFSTGTAKPIPLWLMVIRCLNGGIWSLYSGIKHPLDIFTLIANGSGGLISSILILFWLWFHFCATPKLVTDPTLQLQTMNQDGD